MAELVRMKRVRDGLSGLSSMSDYQRLYRTQNSDKLRNRTDDSRIDYQRKYYAQKRMNSGGKAFDGRVEVMTEYRRQYYLENPEKKKTDMRGDYFRQYYLQNKDKMSKKRAAVAHRRRDGRSMKENRREYNLQNDERNVDYHNRQDERRLKYRRQYDLENNEMKAEYRNLYDDSRPRYHQQYNIRNKERTTVYRQDYLSRNDDLIAENRRQYSLGKKEYFKVYSSPQRTNLSWRTPEIVRDYFDSIASQLNISNFVDWYRISRRQMTQIGGLSLYDKFGNLGAALQFAYPEIKWDLGVFRHRGKKSGQLWLKLKIEELLPGIDVVEDYQHPDLNWEGDSDRTMELDIWIPQHRVGIEFQGEQHYYNIDSLGPSSAAGAYSERDTLKYSMCESRGITLIAIPYWWDGSIDSLSATLYQARPDVFPVSHGRPIQREMPVLTHDNSVQQFADSFQLKNTE